MRTLKTVLFSAVLIISASSAHASLGLKQYYLKGDAVTGTRLQSIEATSSVPFHKRYEELSLKQQNLVKAKFDNLGVNDIPPFPLKGLKSVYQPIVKANKKFPGSESIKVMLQITSEGDVKNVQVKNSQNRNLIRYLEKSLSKVDFEAAQCNGAACDMQFPVEISFN